MVPAFLIIVRRSVFTDMAADRSFKEKILPDAGTPQSSGQAQKYPSKRRLRIPVLFSGGMFVNALLYILVLILLYTISCYSWLRFNTAVLYLNGRPERWWKATGWRKT